MKQFALTLITLSILAACSGGTQSTEGLNPEFLPNVGDNPNLKYELRHNPDTGKDEWIYFMKNFTGEKLFLALGKLFEGALNLVEGTAYAKEQTSGFGGVSSPYMCGDGSVGSSCGRNSRGEEVICCSGSWCTNAATNTCSSAGQCADDLGLKCPFGYTCCGKGQPCVPWGQSCGNTTNCQRDVQRCSNEANAKFQACMAAAQTSAEKNACQDQLTRDTNACGDAYRRCMGQGEISSTGGTTGNLR